MEVWSYFICLLLMRIALCGWVVFVDRELVVIGGVEDDDEVIFVWGVWL